MISTITKPNGKNQNPTKIMLCPMRKLNNSFDSHLGRMALAPRKYTHPKKVQVLLHGLTSPQIRLLDNSKAQARHSHSSTSYKQLFCPFLSIGNRDLRMLYIFGSGMAD